MTDERQPLILLITEFWRMMRTCERILGDLPSEKVAAPSAQLRYSVARLDAIAQMANLTVVSYETGQTYSANLPVVIANVEDASLFTAPVIDRTIEPTIMSNGTVLAMGNVTLKEGK